MAFISVAICRATGGGIPFAPHSNSVRRVTEKPRSQMVWAHPAKRDGVAREVGETDLRGPPRPLRRADLPERG